MNPPAPSDGEIEAFTRSVRVERDVVFFLHQQADYSSIMHDVDWSFFDEDYARELLENRGMSPALQRGCLSLLYAMAMCEAGNVCRALGPRLPATLAHLRLFTTDDVEIQQLKVAAIRAMTFAATPSVDRDWDAISGEVHASAWVHQVTVIPFFRAIASKLGFGPAS